MMNFFKQLTIATSIAVVCFTENIDAQDFQWKENQSNGYTYKYVTNDPNSTRYYTLKNGLTVILSPTDKEPRIQTYIATKAGGKTDPADHTGLAHYLEHLLFKGTNRLGSKDWEKEKPLLEEIDNLYEKYNQTKDEIQRKEIYKQIDRVSGEAAKYAIANEYGKIMSGIGSQNTNAFTEYDKTYYQENIPANVVDKYLTVQAERFRQPTLRLFHTELEAVYEEKNRGLDNDGRKVYEMLYETIFPNSYGKQTVLGTIEHLKNPSVKAIKEYYNTYYVPNNMGVIMSGDFNPDEMIVKIDNAFSYMEAKPIPKFKVGQETTITSPIIKDVYGPTPEYITLAFRFPGASTKDASLLKLVGNMLANGQAGLLDLNLSKKQKLLRVYAFPIIFNDYSVLALQGMPIEGQSLDDVKKLLSQEINKFKKGDFSDDLIQSIVNNEKKRITQSNEKYSSRAEALLEEFGYNQNHKTELEYIQEISGITKKDIMDFASKYLQENNYVAVYKRKGEDKNITKVEKPIITPILMNKTDQSEFFKSVENMPESKINPVWIDFNKDIAKNKIGNIEVLSVKNTDNELFRLNYYFKSGKWTNKTLPYAAVYLDFLGTKSKSSEEISKELYNLASSFTVNVGNEETYITLEGLNENFETIVALFENLIKDCQPDQKALEDYKARIRKSRADAKQNKTSIMLGLRSYAQYGPQNPFNNTLTDAELNALKAEDLVNTLHDLFNYKHQVLYYGPKSGKELVASLAPIHKQIHPLKDLPKSKTFTQIPTDTNKVLFTHYDMVQAEVAWLRNGNKYNPSITPSVNVFNNYFGGGNGWSTIVFQTIRESKALAYSTSSYFNLANKKEDRDIITAYVGTQADKFNEATAAMNDLLTTLPKSEAAFESAKNSLIKSIGAQRITQDKIIFTYLDAQKLGNKSDIRKIIYEQAPKLTFADINSFYNQEMKGKTYTYCITASQDKVNEADMKKLGDVKKLNLNEIFGY